MRLSSPFWPLSLTLTLTGVPALAAPSASPTAASALLLQPGRVTGTVVAYTVKAGEDLEHIAFTHGVAVSHVVQPSKGMLKQGPKRGMRLFIDQRRIVPAFDATLSGILLNLPETEVYLLASGRIVKSYPVGVSVGDADWRAPIGEFKVVNKDDHPTWHIPRRIQAERERKGLPAKTQVPAGPDNPLGNRWIGFADGTFGFHGTLDPASIKHYASHGCVRFLRGDIEDLYQRVEIGSPVHVVYQPVVLAADLGTVWLSAFPDFYHRHVDYRAAVRALAAETPGGWEALDPHKVEQVLVAKDGFVRDVGQK